MTISPEDRPLSPHLQIYRLPITALTSISHRITGVALFLGSLLLLAWLWALAYNGEYFAFWAEIASHPAAKVILIGWTFALFYHLCNGIRHLFWDAGKGFDKCTSRKSSYIVILVAAAMNFALWCSLFKQISFLAL